MGDRIDTTVRGGFAASRVYARIDHIVSGKERGFVEKLTIQRDDHLDLIDAINADKKLQPLAEGDALPKGTSLEAENARRAAAKTELLGPHEKARTILEERIAAHPGGARFWILDLHVTAPDGSKADVPAWDKVKFREVRYIKGAKGAWSIGYRNDPAAPETVVPVVGIDQVDHAYALLQSLPAYAALNPSRDDG